MTTTGDSHLQGSFWYIFEVIQVQHPCLSCVVDEPLWKLRWKPGFANSNYCLHIIVNSCRDICYVVMQTFHFRWRMKVKLMMPWRVHVMKSPVLVCWVFLHQCSLILINWDTRVCMFGLCASASSNLWHYTNASSSSSSYYYF